MTEAVSDKPTTALDGTQPAGGNTEIAAKEFNAIAAAEKPAPAPQPAAAKPAVSSSPIFNILTEAGTSSNEKGSASGTLIGGRVSNVTLGTTEAGKITGTFAGTRENLSFTNDKGAVSEATRDTINSAISIPLTKSKTSSTTANLDNQIRITDNEKGNDLTRIRTRVTLKHDKNVGDATISVSGRVGLTNNRNSNGTGSDILQPEVILGVSNVKLTPGLALSASTQGRRDINLSGASGQTVIENNAKLGLKVTPGTEMYVRGQSFTTTPDAKQGSTVVFGGLGVSAKINDTFSGFAEYTTQLAGNRSAPNNPMQTGGNPDIGFGNGFRFGVVGKF